VRVVHAQPPPEGGVHDGLAWNLFAPAGPPSGGLLLLHGADSRKENHHDVARAAAGGGLLALAFDARGHGASAGALGAGAVDDVVAMAGLLAGRLGGGPVALRGSSMGGYLALVASEQVGAAAVVAICPASAEQLARGLADERFAFRADSGALHAFLAEHPLDAVVPDLEAELLLLHAEGDASVPVAHSRELAGLADPGRSRFVEVPGGDHRSIQHDPELQALALRFLAGALFD
jgi:uncharacterized protein